MLHFYYLAFSMKGNLFILRCAAFLLILVFSQKTGTGLFLHELLHSNTAGNKIPGQENEKEKELSYNCSCIDDFLMPFDETGEPGYSQPVLAFTIPVTFFEDHIPFHTPVFSPLRGPPAFIV